MGICMHIQSGADGHNGNDNCDTTGDDVHDADGDATKSIKSGSLGTSTSTSMLPHTQCELLATTHPLNTVVYLNPCFVKHSS